MADEAVLDEAGDDFEAAEKKGKGSKGKLIILLIVALLLIGGGASAGLYLIGALSPEKTSASGDEDALAEQEEEIRGEAIYVDLHPAFTVNLQSKSQARFLQVSVQILTRDAKVEEAIKRHSPMIRNKLVLLFSGKTSQELRTSEGKENLQKQARSAIEKVLKSETGDGGVEAVFFTSFVMQ